MKHDLYQVQVIERGLPKKVGPQLVKDAAEMFAQTIKAQIAVGREKLWHDPIVVKVSP